MNTLTRKGKHPISVGDLATVAANPESPAGERGWTMAKVLRFIDEGHRVLAVVTRPGQPGVRHVNAARLTRKHA